MDLIETKRSSKHYLRMTIDEYKGHLTEDSPVPKGMIICIVTKGRKRRKRRQV